MNVPIELSRITWKHSGSWQNDILTVEEIIYLHKKLIQTTGGIDELRDRGLLESTIYGFFSSYDDIERYKSIEEKAARYAFGLTKNHTYIDGNKRIGVLSMLMILSLNVNRNVF